jgi:hypothetical protein
MRLHSLSGMATAGALRGKLFLFQSKGPTGWTGSVPSLLADGRIWLDIRVISSDHNQFVTKFLFLVKKSFTLKGSQNISLLCKQQ